MPKLTPEAVQEKYDSLLAYWGAKARQMLEKGWERHKLDPENPDEFLDMDELSRELNRFLAYRDALPPDRREKMIQAMAKWKETLPSDEPPLSRMQGEMEEAFERRQERAENLPGRVVQYLLDIGETGRFEELEAIESVVDGLAKSGSVNTVRKPKMTYRKAPPPDPERVASRNASPSAPIRTRKATPPPDPEKVQEKYDWLLAYWAAQARQKLEKWDEDFKSGRENADEFLDMTELTTELDRFLTYRSGLPKDRREKMIQTMAGWKAKLPSDEPPLKRTLGETPQAFERRQERAANLPGRVVQYLLNIGESGRFEELEAMTSLWEVLDEAMQPEKGATLIGGEGQPLTLEALKQKEAAAEAPGQEQEIESPRALSPISDTSSDTLIDSRSSGRASGSSTPVTEYSRTSTMVFGASEERVFRNADDITGKIREAFETKINAELNRLQRAKDFAVYSRTISDAESRRNDLQTMLKQHQMDALASRGKVNEAQRKEEIRKRREGARQARMAQMAAKRWLKEQQAREAAGEDIRHIDVIGGFIDRLAGRVKDDRRSENVKAAIAWRDAQWEKERNGEDIRHIDVIGGFIRILSGREPLEATLPEIQEDIRSFVNEAGHEISDELLTTSMSVQESLKSMHKLVDEVTEAWNDELKSINEWSASSETEVQEDLETRSVISDRSVQSIPESLKVAQEKAQKSLLEMQHMVDQFSEEWSEEWRSISELSPPLAIGGGDDVETRSVASAASVQSIPEGLLAAKEKVHESLQEMQKMLDLVNQVTEEWNDELRSISELSTSSMDGSETRSISGESIRSIAEELSTAQEKTEKSMQEMHHMIELFAKELNQEWRDIGDWAASAAASENKNVNAPRQEAFDMFDKAAPSWEDIGKASMQLTIKDKLAERKRETLLHRSHKGAAEFPKEHPVHHQLNPGHFLRLEGSWRGAEPRPGLVQRVTQRVKPLLRKPKPVLAPPTPKHIPHDIKPTLEQRVKERMEALEKDEQDVKLGWKQLLQRRANWFKRHHAQSANGESPMRDANDPSLMAQLTSEKKPLTKFERDDEASLDGMEQALKEKTPVIEAEVEMWENALPPGVSQRPAYALPDVKSIFDNADKSIREAIEKNQDPIVKLHQINPKCDYQRKIAGEGRWKDFNGTPLFIPPSGKGPAGEVYIQVEGQQRQPTIVILTAEQVGKNAIPFDSMLKVTVSGQQEAKILRRNEALASRHTRLLVPPEVDKVIRDLIKEDNSLYTHKRDPNPKGSYRPSRAEESGLQEFDGVLLFIPPKGVGPAGEAYFRRETGNLNEASIVVLSAKQLGAYRSFDERCRVKIQGQEAAEIKPLSDVLKAEHAEKMAQHGNKTGPLAAIKKIWKR